MAVEYACDRCADAGCPKCLGDVYFAELMTEPLPTHCMDGHELNPGVLYCEQCRYGDDPAFAKWGPW